MKDTLPPIDILAMSEEELKSLRMYEGYWCLVKKAKFIQIFLDPEDIQKQKKTFIKAIKKEKQKDKQARYSGQLSFSWFENILFVRLL